MKTNTKNQVRKLVFAGLCVAIGIVLDVYKRQVLRRMEGFPIRVGLLSRFRTPKQQDLSLIHISLAPVAGLRVNATPVPEVSPMLPNAII